MSTAPPFALYNPAMLPPEVLLAEFTARLPLLARLLGVIRANAPGEPPQHGLLVGPRGMGKTTLLWAIASSIDLREPELRRQWQPVVFDEESRRIGDLADFWIECLQQWEAATEPHLTRSLRVDALLDKPGPDLEDRAREAFLHLVEASGKRALLLIDNLNDILAVLHDEEPLLRLRSFLMSESRVMIIGTATRWFSDVTALDKPFFEFFRSFELGPLNLVEMRECLAGIAKARGDQNVLDALERRAGSIEALHLLTGGNPRLIRTFYRLLNEGMNGEMRQQLERLLDDYTPYHKAIIDSLPAQQQRVFDAVALHWNPCDVATVARTTRLPSNQVSAQIKALAKAGLVSEVPAAGTGKKKAYLLTDRFSNIHYLMRHGRAGRMTMHWYIMTLRALFDDTIFADSAAKAVREMSRAGGPEASEGMLLARSALRYAGSESARRRFLDRIAGSLEFDAEVNALADEQVCRHMVEDNPGDAYVRQKWARFLDVHSKQLAEAEAEYRMAIQLDSHFAEPWNGLGNLLRKIPERQVEAEAAYRKAIELDSAFASPWNNLGNLLSKSQGRQAEAEAAYRQAMELDSTLAAPWSGLGDLWSQSPEPDRQAEAETAYLKAIQLDPKWAWPWNGFGNLLSTNPVRQAEAEEAYHKAIELDPKGESPWFNLGILLGGEPGRRTEAEVAYRQAIELGPKGAWPWYNLGNLLSGEPGRRTEAEAAYRQAIELDPNDARPWNNLGNLLSDEPGHQAEAEAAYRQAIELDPKSPRPWYNLGNLLSGDPARRTEAETAYRQAIELDPLDADPRSALSWLLQSMGRMDDECRDLALRGLLLDPSYSFAREQFQAVGFTDASSLRSALPELSAWCGGHAEASEVFAFAVEAWLALASTTTAAKALALLDGLPEGARLPFDLVRQAFLAHADPDLLHHLAPERRAPVLKLLERMRERKSTRSERRKA